MLFKKNITHIYIYFLMLFNLNIYFKIISKTVFIDTNNNLFEQYNYAANKVLGALENIKSYSEDNLLATVFDGLIDMHRFILNTGYPQNKLDNYLINKHDLNLISHYLDAINYKISDIELNYLKPKTYAINELLNEAVIRVNYLKDYI